MTTETTSPQGVDRREALKKAALAAGVVAWTTPVVQAVTPGIASASTNVTGCVPRISVSLRQTGGSCDCAGDSPNCCNAQSYVSTVTADCGATCDGAVDTTELLLVDTATRKNGCRDDAYNFFADCPSTVAVYGTVTCPDGVTTIIPREEPYTATVTGCARCTTIATAPVAEPAVVEQPALLEEPAPAEEPAPTEELTPAEQPEPAPAQEPAPAEEPAPAPAEDPAPAEEPAPAPAEDPAPVEDAGA